MKIVPLSREAILPRISGIGLDLEKLRELVGRGRDAFVERSETFDLAQHHLRLALEGVFHIGSHILSRLAGGRSTEYAEIARRLGECGVVPRDFANTRLVSMAKMRNMLTHFYAKIEPKKLFDTLETDLADVETYLGYIKKLLKNPQKFGLTVE